MGTERESRPLRLGILNLFEWTTGSALLLFALQDFPTNQAPSPTQQSLELVSRLVYALLGGIAVASLGPFLRLAFRRPTTFPVEPGHWLLVARGLGLVAWIVTTAVTFRTSPAGDPRLPWTAGIYGFALSTFISGAVLLAAVCSLRDRTWVGTLIGYTFLSAIMFGLRLWPDLWITLLPNIYSASLWRTVGLLQALLLLVAYMTDCVRGPPRDPMHHVGTGSILAHHLWYHAVHLLRYWL